MLLKGYEIWLDDLGRWCVYCEKSPYTKESDHKVFNTKKEAKEFAKRHKEESS